MSESTSHPDAWLDDVRRWYFGGTPPPNYEDNKLPRPPGTLPPPPMGSPPARPPASPPGATHAAPPHKETP